MAKEEEKELESVIQETEAPSRADDRKGEKKRVAKLTGRTISSLRTKIKESRLSRAFDKYNKKYAEMRRALRTAEETKVAQATDNTISDSEVLQNYDIVASYNKKLAKYAVKLLEDEIKRVVAVEGKKAKPIRVPRILPKKLRKLIGKISDKRKTKKLQQEEVKDIKKATKAYIASSLDDALFKNAAKGELRSKIDADVIKGLKVASTKDEYDKETFDDKIANLKGFISADGKNPLFEEEIGAKKSTTGTDVPPVEPTSDVKDDKVTPAVNTEDLLKGLGKKTPPTEDTKEKNDSVTTEPEVKKPKVTIDDLMKGITTPTVFTNENEEQKKVEDAPKTDPIVTPTVVEDKKENESENKIEAVEEVTKSDEVDESKALRARRKREISKINTIVSGIKSIEEQMETIKDPNARAKLQAYIDDLNKDLDTVINSPQKAEEKKDDNSLEPIEVKAEEKKEEEVTKEEPKQDVPVVTKVYADGEIVTVPAKPDDAMTNVTVKENESLRAEQISSPSALRITPQDIKNMEARNNEAKAQVERLLEERKDLESQKAMYQQFLEQAKAAKAREEEAQKLSEGNASLAAEVNELGLQAVEFEPNIGRVKK